MFVIGILTVLLVTLGAQAVGRAVLTPRIFKSKPPFPDAVLSGVAATALGMMGIVFLLFGLVAVRLVYRGLLWGIVAACALLAGPRDRPMG